MDSIRMIVYGSMPEIRQRILPNFALTAAELRTEQNRFGRKMVQQERHQWALELYRSAMAH